MTSAHVRTAYPFTGHPHAVAEVGVRGRETSTVVPTCTVVICAYTEARWDLLSKGYRCVVEQLRDGDEIVVVIDFNPGLLARAVAEFDRATVLQNTGPTGLSGGRNTGVAAARGDVVVFLDDDAWPFPGWLDAYRNAFTSVDIGIVAGRVDAEWQGDGPPAWFPLEFGWVVGCDYRGLPGDQEHIRNPIGANMAIRRDLILAVGGFSTDVGRVGTIPAGCEETELSIRISQAMPSLRKIRLTGARVGHVVPVNRQTWRYFASRCFHEGRSKKILADSVGSGDGLGSERTYVTRVLTSGFVRELFAPLVGRLTGPSRTVAITVGLAATATGYLTAGLAQVSSRPGAKKRRWRRDGETSPMTLGDVPAAASFRPLRVVDYELESGIASVAGVPIDTDSATAGRTDRVRLLILANGNPLGFLDLEPGQDIPRPDQVASHFGVERLSRHLAGPTPVERFAADPEAPHVTVVVPTRGRRQELANCVQSLLAQGYPSFEVIVVDNNDDPAVVLDVLADSLRDDRLAVVHEPRPGASVARNTGTASARGVLIAATDDDVIAASSWLAELVATFDDKSIDCVTGLVLPNGLQTPAQELFEEFGGFSKGFAPARFDLLEHRSAEPLYPYSVGMFGSGNNVAFRTSALQEIGGYDERLGPGTPIKSGEDLDVFLKLLFAGRTLAYQPRARISHNHRRSMDELHVQMRHYGRGLSAVILKWALSDPRRFMEILRRLPAGLRRLLDGGSDRNSGRTAAYPASLKRAELRGSLEGGFLLPVQVLRHHDAAQEVSQKSGSSA